MKNWKSCLIAMAALIAVATIHAQSSGTYTGYNFTANGTATGFGGATASSSLTDNVVSKTSPTVLAVAAGRFGFGSLSVAPVSAVGFTITSLSVTGATNASPIVLTVSSTTGTSLRNNDTVVVSGVGGNTAANGTWLVEVASSTTIKLLGSTGNGSYTSGGTVAGAGSGTAYIYGTPQGYITIMAPSSAALIMTCTGTCNMNQAASPDWPTGGGSVPLATVSITSGNWDTVTDARRFLNAGYSLQAGTGISIAPSGGEATVAVDSTVARTSGTNTFTGSNSFTAATRTAPCRTGSGSPSALNGTAGDCYWQTDATAGQNLWWATTTGTPATWTLQAGGSSVSVHDQTRIDLTDEFVAVATSGSVGSLGWNISNGTGSGTLAYQTNPGAARWGVMRVSSGASNGDNTGLALGGVSAVDATTNWEAQWIISPVSVTSVQYVIGITNLGAIASNYIGMRFDSATDTNWKFEACASSTCSTTDSGVAVTAGNWYRFRLRTTSSGTYLLSVNGGSETSISTNVPTTSNMRLTAVVQTKTGSAKDLDVDRFSLTRTGISR